MQWRCPTSPSGSSQQGQGHSTVHHLVRPHQLEEQSWRNGGGGGPLQRQVLGPLPCAGGQLQGDEQRSVREERGVRGHGLAGYNQIVGDRDVCQSVLRLMAPNRRFSAWWLHPADRQLSMAD